MKAGRPANHIKACWITLDMGENREKTYRLDKYGCLIKDNGVIKATEELAEETKKDCVQMIPESQKIDFFDYNEENNLTVDFHDFLFDGADEQSYEFLQFDDDDNSWFGN